MVEHRKNPRTKVKVPAGWFIVVSVVACVGAAGWLGVMLVGPTPASADGAPGTDSAAASSPSPKDDQTETAAPETATPETGTPETDSPEPSPTASATPASRTAPVSILNNTGIKNLAKTFSVTVSDAGWTVSGLGNWRGQIVSNTVYYPDGMQQQAELLADDVGIERVMPSIVPMRMDRLNIILSGPQQ